MAVTGYTDLRINNIQLQTLGWNVLSLTGIDGMPGRRGQNNPTPYQDGDYSFGDKFYQSRSFVLGMVVMGNDVDGDVTASDGPLYHLRNNLDYLKGVFNQNSGLQTFSYYAKDGVGGGATREIDVEILQPFAFREYKKFQIGFAVELIAPRPFWRETPAEQVVRSAVVATDNFSIDTAGNAPVNDMVITIDCNTAGSNPSLECVATGDLITIQDSAVTSDTYVLDLGTKSFTKNGSRADSLISRNTAYFMRLPPSATLAMRFDATSFGSFDLTLDWNKKWL